MESCDEGWRFEVIRARNVVEPFTRTSPLGSYALRKGLRISCRNIAQGGSAIGSPFSAPYRASERSSTRILLARAAPDISSVRCSLDETWRIRASRHHLWLNRNLTHMCTLPVAR